MQAIAQPSRGLAARPASKAGSKAVARPQRATLRVQAAQAASVRPPVVAATGGPSPSTSLNGSAPKITPSAAKPMDIVSWGDEGGSCAQGRFVPTHLYHLYHQAQCGIALLTPAGVYFR